MTKWRIRKDSLYQPTITIINQEGREVAFFEREKDATRCIEAVNEVEKLREELATLEAIVGMNEEQYSTIVLGNKRLREALAFYARLSDDMGYDEIAEDHGQIACAALAKKEL